MEDILMSAVPGLLSLFGPQATDAYSAGWRAGWESVERDAQRAAPRGSLLADEDFEQIVATQDSRSSLAVAAETYSPLLHRKTSETWYDPMTRLWHGLAPGPEPAHMDRIEFLQWLDDATPEELDYFADQ